MANEITVTMTLKLAKSGISTQLSGSYKASQTGQFYEAGLQSIGTSPEETLAKGDIGTIGYALVKNTDDTNYVELGTSSGVYSTKLKPGEAALMPPNSTAIYAKANTASVNVEYLLIEA